MEGSWDTVSRDDLLVPKKTCEASLLKMAIRRKGNRNRMFPHDDKARTVNETPRFVVVFCQQAPSRFILRRFDMENSDPISRSKRTDNAHLFGPRHSHRTCQERHEFGHHVAGGQDRLPVLPCVVQQEDRLIVKRFRSHEKCRPTGGIDEEPFHCSSDCGSKPAPMYSSCRFAMSA